MVYITQKLRIKISELEKEINILNKKLSLLESENKKLFSIQTLHNKEKFQWLKVFQNYEDFLFKFKLNELFNNYNKFKKTDVN